METHLVLPTLEAPPTTEADHPGADDPIVTRVGAITGTSEDKEALRSILEDAVGPAPARFLREAWQEHGE